MDYRTVTLKMVVAADDIDAATQKLNDALDDLAEQIIVYSSEIDDQLAAAPENAAEIAAT